MQTTARYTALAAALVALTQLTAAEPSAAATAELVQAYLGSKILTLDKRRPVQISVREGAQPGTVAELRVKGQPALLKDIRAERVEAHAAGLTVDHAKLEKDHEFVVSSVRRFYLSAEVTAAALTDRINAGRRTKELQATVTFRDGKAFITGTFQYSFLRGTFEAELRPVIQHKNQIVFLLERLKVGGVPAPASVRRLLQKRMKPLDMGELLGVPKVDRVWIAGGRLKLVAGKPF